MKKVLALIAIAVAMTASADLVAVDWTSATLGTTPGGDGSEMQSFQTFLGNATIGAEGTDWAVAVFNSTDLGGTALQTSVTGGWGWYDGYGYTLEGFNFTEVEGQTVVMRLYNNASDAAATHYLDTVAFALPDLVQPTGAGDSDMTFDFTGSTWQAVPEPATVLLFGIGGLGAFVIRRNKMKAQEEA